MHAGATTTISQHRRQRGGGGVSGFSGTPFRARHRESFAEGQTHNLPQAVRLRLSLAHKPACLFIACSHNVARLLASWYADQILVHVGKL